MKIGVPRSDNGSLAVVPFTVSERACVSSILATRTYVELKERLSCFANWVWDKGDMFVWTPVLNRLDEVLAVYVLRSGLADLPGNSSKGLKERRPFDDGFDYEGQEGLDAECVIYVLRTMQIIVESCTAKAMLNSVGNVMLLLDSCDTAILENALFIIVIVAFVARRGKKSVDAPWMNELLQRLNILAAFPNRIVAEHDSTNSTPLSFYSDLHWHAVPSHTGRYTLISTGQPVIISNGDIREKLQASLASIKSPNGTSERPPSERPPSERPSSERPSSERPSLERPSVKSQEPAEGRQASDIVDGGREAAAGVFTCQHEKRLAELSTAFGVKETRLLRHRMRILLNEDHLNRRRRLVDDSLLALMCIMTLSPLYFQQHTPHKLVMAELGLLTRSHKCLNYSTLALVIDMWVTLLHEKVNVKHVSQYLQLQMPHGIMCELIRTYVGNEKLYPKEAIHALPELLFEKNDLDPEGGCSARDDNCARTDGSRDGKNSNSEGMMAVEEDQSPALSLSVCPAVSIPEAPVTEDPDEIVPPNFVPQVVCKTDPQPICEDITAAAYTSRDLYERLKICVPREIPKFGSSPILNGTSCLPSIRHIQHIRSHAEVVTALLDLYQESLFACSSAALGHPTIVKQIARLLEVRDYRYIQACMSALRAMESYYDNSGAALKNNVRELNIVHTCAQRLRYELACIHQLNEYARDEGWITDTLTPWTGQGQCEDVEGATRLYMIEPGVPTNWHEAFLRGSYFWQIMEEITNRRSLTAALVKDGPILLWYPYSGTQQTVASELIEEFGLAFRYIFQHPKEVGYVCASAAVQSLGDCRNEDPASQSHLTRSGLIECLYDAMPSLAKSESCMAYLPSFFSQLCVHSLGIKDLKRRNGDFIIAMAEQMADPSLAYYDRVSHITSSVGHTVDTSARLYGDLRQVYAICFSKLLAQLKQDLMQTNSWKVRQNSQALVREMVLQPQVSAMKDLQLPPTPAHEFIMDRISNVSRMLLFLVQVNGVSVLLDSLPIIVDCSPPLQVNIAQLLLDILIATDADGDLKIPPLAFTHCLPTHPISPLVKCFLMYMSRIEIAHGPFDQNFLGLTFRRTIKQGCDLLKCIEQARLLQASAAAVKNAAAVQSAPAIKSTPFLGLQASQKGKHMVLDELGRLRKAFVASAHMFGSYLSLLAGCLKERAVLTHCAPQYQVPLLLAVASLLPVVQAVFAPLLDVLYSELMVLNNCQDCPTLLTVRNALQEPPALLAAKVDARRQQHHPLAESSCFHLETADPVATSIGRPCLGPHAFLWSSLSDWAYSAGNAMLDADVPIAPYELEENLVEQKGPAEPLEPWQSDSLIKELLRGLCLAARLFLTAASRSLNAASRDDRPRDFYDAQRVVAGNLVACGRTLLHAVPDSVAPDSETKTAPWSLGDAPVDLGEGASALVRRTCYVAECWDVLYRAHIDDKAQGGLVPQVAHAAARTGLLAEAARAV
ncbi:hypothetical protein GNI_133400, partial [Gregarina niphandrodes]